MRASTAPPALPRRRRAGATLAAALVLALSATSITAGASAPPPSESAAPTATPPTEAPPTEPPVTTSAVAATPPPTPVATNPATAPATTASTVPTSSTTAGPVTTVASDVTIRLVAQPISVAPDGDAIVVLHVEGTVPPDATIAVTAYPRVETRGDVRDAIDRSPSGSPVDVVEYDIAALTAENGDLTLDLGTTTSRQPPRDRLALRSAGLYPIKIEVRSGDEPLAGLLTFLERVGDTATTAPVRTAVLLSVDAAPTLQADGSTVITDTTRNEIDQLATTLEAAVSAMTVVIRPELLEGLARTGFAADQARLTRLSAALANHHELLPATYVAIDPATSVRSDLGAEFVRQLLWGEDVLSRTLGISTARQTWPIDAPIDGGGLELLRTQGFRQLLLAADIRSDLPKRDGALGTPSTEGDRIVPSLAADLVVQARLAQRTADPVLAAHQIMADLVAMSIEDEAAAAKKKLPTPLPLGVLIDASDPDLAASPVLADLLGLLGQSPRIVAGQASDVVDALQRLTSDAALDRIPMKRPAETDEGPDVAATVRRLDDAISTTRSMLPSADVRPNDWIALAKVVPAQNLSADARTVIVDQLDGEIGVVRECVTVLSSGQISLGSRSSQVPLALKNSCPVPMKVRVRVSSPKLVLKEPEQIVTVTDRLQLSIPVEARTNGVFVVNIELLTPDGQPPAQLTSPNTFTVRASALTGLGQVISGALLLVLATWWIQHVRGRRRASRAAGAESRLSAHPSAAPESG